jgi:ribosomal protein L11 methyltransferase
MRKYSVYYLYSAVEDVEGLIPSSLGFFPFDSFSPIDGGWVTSCEIGSGPSVDSILIACPLVIGVDIKEVEEENYNEQWESTVSPIDIMGRVYIRASFHPPPLEGDVIDLCISPEMTFGTGHHSTTRLIAERLIALENQLGVVLDMGCGTGILGLLSLHLGAVHVDAVDIDKRACAVCEGHFSRSIFSGKYKVIHDSIVPSNRFYTTILANIQLQTLIEMRDSLLGALLPGGRLLMSGILTEQRPALIDAYGGHCSFYNESDVWSLVEITRYD